MNEQTRSNNLHDALDAYEELPTHEADSGVISTATLHSRQFIVRRLKKHHDDLPLSEIDLDMCVDMIGHWRDRPTSKTTGKPIADSTAQRTLSELIRFFGWLETSDQFEWVVPSYLGQISRRIDDDAS